MSEKVGKLLKYGLSFLLAAVLLYFAFRRVDWVEFWKVLKECRWGFVILSMLFGALAFYVRALRWRQILRPIDPSTSALTCFNAINISNVVNMALPRVGEFVRCGYITAHSARDAEDAHGKRLASYDKVLGTVALDRSADVLTLLFLVTIFLLFTWKRFGGFFMESIFGAAADGFSLGKALVLGGLGLAAVVTLALVIFFSDKWAPLAKVKNVCKGIWNGFVSCFHMEKAWLFFVLTAMIWGCYWMMSCSILWAVQGISPDTAGAGMASTLEAVQNLDMVDALFLMIAGSLSSLVPVPGGFGAFHFIVAGAISSVYGIPFEFGLIFATLSHESQTINQIVCGSLSYISESFRKN